MTLELIQFRLLFVSGINKPGKLSKVSSHNDPALCWQSAWIQTSR